MLLWIDLIDIIILSSSSNDIDCYLTVDLDFCFHFSGFYDAPESSSRHLT